VFVAQVPVASVGETVNLRGWSTWRGGLERDLPRLGPDVQENLRRETVLAAERAQKDFVNLQVLRADRRFYHDDGSVRYASGRKFFYADDDHLSEAGVEEVRDLFLHVLAEMGTARLVFGQEKL
jgi:hypothetical protein